MECRFDNLPNGFVLFWFKNAADKQRVIDGGTYYAYGKLMSIRILPETFRLDNCDLCMVPVWVRLPGLPKPCWHPTALSRIASCISTPISRDTMTRDVKKGEYARVLVEVDSSGKLPLTVQVNVAGEFSFEQQLFYEFFPQFCTFCRGVLC